MRAERRDRRQRQRTVAVILCAGQGSRMGAPHNKVFLPLAGKPLLVHTVQVFEQAREIDEIVLVTHSLERTYCQAEIVERYHTSKVSALVVGGDSRHQSEDAALQSLRPRIEAGEIDVVLIHDGARPFVEPRHVDALAREARQEGGAILATPLAADEVLLRITEDGAVLRDYPPSELWRAQTPQAFSARQLLAAYDAARDASFEGTDTAATYERLGLPIRVIAGSRANLKLTTPDDVLRAEALAHNFIHP